MGQTAITPPHEKWTMDSKGEKRYNREREERFVCQNILGTTSHHGQSWKRSCGCILKRDTYRQLADKFNKPFKTIQNTIYNEYKKQRLLLEHGKVPKCPSSFLNPTADQYLALQKENRQLRMENELLRNFHQKLGKK